MDVLATQLTANVNLKSDTVNVDVNPGDLEFPLQASTPQVAHIHQYIPPVLGKRSRLNVMNKPTRTFRGARRTKEFVKKVSRYLHNRTLNKRTLEY